MLVPAPSDQPHIHIQLTCLTKGLTLLFLACLVFDMRRVTLDG